VPSSVTDQLAADPDDDATVDAQELMSWAMDVQSEAHAWEKIADDLLAARAVDKLKKAA
jgi:hypothetical protein